MTDVTLNEPGGLVSALSDEIVSSSDGQSQGWMVSFADLMALLLTFMVLGFSMNKVDDVMWAEVAGGLGLAFMGEGSAQSVSTIKAPDVRQSGMEARYAADLLVRRVDSLSESDVEVTPVGVLVDITATDISELAGVLMHMEDPVTIQITGYMATDAKPIQRQLAWERALAEAVNRKVLLMEAGLRIQPMLTVVLTHEAQDGYRTGLLLSGEGQL